MFRTTTVSQLRADLSSLLSSLDEGPLIVLSHSKPKAMLIDPELFDNLVERIELLEDLLDGQRAVTEYLADPDIAVDAEKVFERIGK